MSERHSVSIAVILENVINKDFRPMAGGLLLVQKRKSQLLGLIAGHLEKETETEGILREITEETGISPQKVVLGPSTRVITIPQAEKTSVGIIFSGKTTFQVPQEGYEPESEEISLVKPFSIDEIMSLLQHPELIYKPDFNLVLLSKVILDYIGIKYAFDGVPFQQGVARSWGIEEQHIRQFL